MRTPHRKANNCWSPDDAIEATTKALSVMQIYPTIDDNWYLDAGATHTMTLDGADIHGKTIYKGFGKVDGLILSHLGHARFNLSEVSPVTCGFLLVPSVAKTLISAPQLAKNNNWSLFTSSGKYKWFVFTLTFIK